MLNKWSKEIVVRHILKRHRKEQELNSNYVQQNCVPLYQAGCKYCGSWRKSIEAAGLSYDDVRILKRVCPKWSKENIIKIIRRRYRSSQALNSNHVQTKESCLYASAMKYFGGWSQAISAAGLDYSKIRRKDPMRSWSQAMIVEEIIRRSGEGLSIGGGDVSLDNRGLYQAVMRHFGEGGWARARVLAGFDPIDPRPWKIWNEQTVVAEIKRLHERGVQLNTGSLQKGPYKNVLAGACKVFGSWAKAIRAAGLDYSKIRKARMNWWTKPRIIMCIKALEGRGIRLSHRAIQISHCSLLGAAVVYFGCWSQAVEASGISYQAHCRVWSTKAWLRRMTDEKYKTTIERSQIHARNRKEKR